MGRDQTAFFLVYYKIYFCVFNEGSIENDIQYQDGHIIPFNQSKSHATGTAFGLVLEQYCFAPGTGTLPSIVNFSLNKIPDVIGKLAFKSSLASHKFHIEGIGMYRQFYDRAYTSAHTNVYPIPNSLPRMSQELLFEFLS